MSWRDAEHTTDDMVREFISILFIVAVAILFFVACNPPPRPTPTPPIIVPPTSTLPAPMATAPLRVDGTRFVRVNRRGEIETVKLMGAVACCDSAKTGSGWPWASEAFLKQAAAHGANYAHIRLGPFTNAETPTKLFEGDPKLYRFEPYIRLAHPTPGYHSMYNPRDGWAPGYWDSVKRLLSIALDLGLYVEVDVADGWVLRNNRLVNIEGTMVNSLSPWESAEPSIKLSTPRTWHREWVEGVALETGSFPNVIYSIGNENFLPAGKVGPDWELGIQGIIRGVEAKRGYVRHLIGTNSLLPEIEKKVDYVITHDQQAVKPRWGHPLIVNENGDKLTAAEWAAQARRARVLGSEMMLWRGDMNETQFQAALDEMAKIQAE